MKQKKVLLIGGAGYIGSVMTAAFLKKGYYVRCLDALIYKNKKSIESYIGNSDYDFIKGDLRDFNVVKKSLEGITDVVVLAGLVGDPITKKYPEESRLVNEEGIQALFKMFNGHGLGHVVFISTCSNYGLAPGNAPVDENSPLKPLSAYAKAKVAAEKILLSLKGEVDYSATILRFATAFGLSQRMRFDLTISEFTRDMFLGKELLVYDPDTWRPYCHVLDFARAVDLILESDKAKTHFEVFNAGGDENNATKRMLVEMIKKQIPDASIRYQEHGSDPRNYRVSFSKIQNILGFKPEVNIEAGISELINELKNGGYAREESLPEELGNYVVYIQDLKLGLTS